MAFVRESLMRQPPDGYARSCEALADAQAVDTAKIGCPTLLVTGDEDARRAAAGGAADGRADRRPAARVQVEVLRGCGHWTPVEMPDECSDLLRALPTRSR